MYIYNRKKEILLFSHANYFELAIHFAKAQDLTKPVKAAVIVNSPELVTMPDLPAWLPELIVHNCSRLKTIPLLPPPLTLLSLTGCPVLGSITGDITQLSHLRVRECPKLVDNMIVEFARRGNELINEFDVQTANKFAELYCIEGFNVLC